MELIKVGSVIISNYDNYWHFKQLMYKYQDMILRGFGVAKEKLDTPFAKSCLSSETQSSVEYFNDMIKAIKIFENKYPIEAENWK
jgi:hypothetical protein